VIGKQVHDARLIAVCHVHAVMHLLMFNIPHLQRMAGFVPVRSLIARTMGKLILPVAQNYLRSTLAKEPNHAW